MTKVHELQYPAGGIVVFPETENNEKLLDFYDAVNGFKAFETREAVLTEKEQHTLIQMLKTIYKTPLREWNRCLYKMLSVNGRNNASKQNKTWGLSFAYF